MKKLIPLCALILLAACQHTYSQSSEDQLAKLFSGGMKIIDLTHPLNSTSPAWPGDSDVNPFSYTAIATQPSGAASLGAHSTVEHYGTHLDAPIHFADNTASVDQINTTDLFAPVAVIDVRDQCLDNADYRLTVEDLKDWEEKHGNLPEGGVVMMLTGWGTKWGDQEAYHNQDEQGIMHFPGFSVEANEFLVEERNIKGIGIDNFSVDYGMSANFEAHGITNGAGKYNLENVANLDQLRKQELT